MNRPLHILLMLLLLATTAGRGMAASAMIGCTEMPMASHAEGGHQAASAHAGMDASCDASSASMAHDLGLCCLACVALPLPAGLTNLSAAPVRAAPLLGDPERYRSIVPAPLRRPPRSLA